MTGDLDLLRQFARENSQDAFTEIVRRHVNLVHSAALRQIRSPQLAEEVAQSVFTDLARDAGKLKADTILTAWLYAVTRRTAIDVVRKESRRQLREQIAVEMTNMNATSADWTHIEPLLDDAMAALDETDRSAILLRYFENKNLREVGESLKISDDAAQKRVSRAVEKLGEFFSKRGVSVGAGGLAIVISASAVQSAPVGLASTISAAAVLAGTAVKTSTIIAATKTIAMTTLQKTLVTATIAVAAGAVIYAFQLQNQIRLLQQQQTSLTEQIQQLQQERDNAKNQLAALQQENEQLNANETELLKLRGEVTLLRRQQNVSAPTKSETNNLAHAETTSIHVRIKFISLPSEDLQAFGVSWMSDAGGGKTGFLTEQQFKTINEAMQGASDVNVISVPQIITFDRGQARVSATKAFPVGGTNASVGTSLDVTPYFSTNSSTFVLDLNAQFTQLTGDLSRPDLQTVQATNQVTLSPGQTVVLEKEIPPNGWMPDFTNITVGPRSLLVFVTPQVVDSRGFPKRQ
jgi:RNA polymerase sigma factor (sigma-70 family)